MLLEDVDDAAVLATDAGRGDVAQQAEGDADPVPGVRDSDHQLLPRWDVTSAGGYMDKHDNTTIITPELQLSSEKAARRMVMFSYTYTRTRSIKCWETPLTVTTDLTRLVTGRCGVCWARTGRAVEDIPGRRPPPRAAMLHHFIMLSVFNVDFLCEYISASLHRTDERSNRE